MAHGPLVILTRKSSIFVKNVIYCFNTSFDGQIEVKLF